MSYDGNEVLMNTPTSRDESPSAVGHCVWEFNGDTWSLKKNEARNGGVPGAPPTAPGRFQGQLRATPCVTAS